ncbi:hypothetical protein EC973_004393 [Apophysomyces ossiformis]|uniref:Uncharacterized protein n=1 Tax=Apophysomyces ossiformis TaxID=679940 RepID=A0A8H7ESH9_9FUNG|nr:hypothetical protein EC973_004393 [Apophysomyces ossiformis]
MSSTKEIECLIISQLNDNDRKINERTSETSTTAVYDNKALTGSTVETVQRTVSQANPDLDLSAFQPTNSVSEAPQHDSSANTPQSPFSIVSITSTVSESISSSASGFVLVNASPAASSPLSSSWADAALRTEAATSNPASPETNTKSTQEQERPGASITPQFAFGKVEATEERIPIAKQSVFPSLRGELVFKTSNAIQKQDIRDSAEAISEGNKAQVKEEDSRSSSWNMSPGDGSSEYMAAESSPFTSSMVSEVPKETAIEVSKNYLSGKLDNSGPPATGSSKPTSASASSPFNVSYPKSSESLTSARSAFVLESTVRSSQISNDVPSSAAPSGGFRFRSGSDTVSEAFPETSSFNAPKQTTTENFASKPFVFPMRNRSDEEQSGTPFVASSSAVKVSSGNMSGFKTLSNTATAHAPTASVFGMFKKLEEKPTKPAGPFNIGTSASNKTISNPVSTADFNMKNFSFGGFKRETTEISQLATPDKSADIKATTSATNAVSSFPVFPNTSVNSTSETVKTSGCQIPPISSSAENPLLKSAFSHAKDSTQISENSPSLLFGISKTATAVTSSFSKSTIGGSSPSVSTLDSSKSTEEKEKQDKTNRVNFKPSITTASDASSPSQGASSFDEFVEKSKSSSDVAAPISSFSFGKPTAIDNEQNGSRAVSLGPFSTAQTTASNKSYPSGLPLFGNLPKPKSTIAEAPTLAPQKSIAAENGNKDKPSGASFNYLSGMLASPAASTSNSNSQTLVSSSSVSIASSATVASSVPTLSLGVAAIKPVDNVPSGPVTGINGLSTTNTTVSIPANIQKENAFSLDKTISDLSNATYQLPNRMHVSLVTPSLAGLQQNQIVCNTNFRIDNILPTTRVGELPQQAQQELEDLQCYMRTEMQKGDYMLRHNSNNTAKLLDKTATNATSLAKTVNALVCIMKGQIHVIQNLFESTSTQLRYSVDSASLIEACKYPGGTAPWLFGRGVDDEFFHSLALQLQARLEEYKRCIWEIERTAESWMQNKTQSPDGK